MLAQHDIHIKRDTDLVLVLVRRRRFRDDLVVSQNGCGGQLAILKISCGIGKYLAGSADLDLREKPVCVRLLPGLPDTPLMLPRLD